MLSQLDWPGNIRQLENAVYRAVVMSDGDQLGLADFPQAAAHSPAMPEAHRARRAADRSSRHFIRPRRPWFRVTKYLSRRCHPPASLAMLTGSGEMRPLEEMEAEIIRFAIAHYRGQMSEVARRLKIGRSTLYRKLDEAAADDSPSRRTSQAEARRAIVALRCPDEAAEAGGDSGTFEPLLGGDRQREKRVAKARNPLQSGSVEVSLS